MTRVEPDADAALRLVLGADADVARAIVASDQVSLGAFVAALRDNVVLLRATAILRDLGLATEALEEEAEVERARVDRVLACLGRIVDALEREGIEHVLPKAFQHAPDMGHDVDLFVGEGGSRVAAILARVADARPVRTSPVSRFAGKRAYDVLGVGPIEVHHGRLGHVGEHRALARALLVRRRRGRMGPVEAWVPAPEDHLLLQVIQRVHAHGRIRASDILRTLATVRSPELDDAYVTASARTLGIAGALRWYLAVVDALARRAGAEGRAGAPVDGVAVPPARSWGYAVPLTRVAGAYAAVLGAAARAGELESVLRIAAIPGLAVATILERARPRSR